jgi:uncharacterized membrane protein
MGSRWPARLAVAALAAVTTHAAVIYAAPYALMSVAMKRLGGDGHAVNRWAHGPRTTERSRGVVRPSPDLAYSACVFDLSNGPVRVTAAPWRDYWSVSVYAANSDNIFVANDRRYPRGVDLMLTRGKDAAPPGVLTVRVPSERGIVLARRLAPTAEAFAAADASRQGDRCEAAAGR